MCTISYAYHDNSSAKCMKSPNVRKQVSNGARMIKHFSRLSNFINIWGITFDLSRVVFFLIFLINIGRLEGFTRSKSKPLG